MNSKDETLKSKKIAKNTILLYIRMMIIMIINLYSVRLVLNALGCVDYGVFNVVAGVVTMLQCVTTVLATSTQRFYSFSLGENNTSRLKNIFSISLNIYIFLSIIILLLGETVGLWILNHQLVIPADRIMSANYIYQFSLLSFIFTMLNIPYSSAIIAHEDMNIYATISIIDCLLKLFLAISLSFIIIDRLSYYGLILFIISIVNFLLYSIISFKKYIECHYSKVTESHLYNELLSFSGWSLFGSSASVGMNQLCTVFTNLFFGPVVNTSRAIAFQIGSAVNAFSSNFIMAIRPPMIKAYAEDSHLYLNKIFNISNKFIFYCLLVVFLPLMFEMDTILLLWLKISDYQTIQFSRLILIYAMIMALNNPISIIIQATGFVKQYHISVEFFTLLTVPITYLFFKLGYQAYTAIVIMIMASVISHIVRIICLKKFYKPFNLPEYLWFVVQAIFVTLITSFLIYLIHISINNQMLRLIIVVFSSVTVVFTFSFVFALSKEEKTILLNYVKSKNK